MLGTDTLTLSAVSRSSLAGISNAPWSGLSSVALSLDRCSTSFSCCPPILSTPCQLPSSDCAEAPTDTPSRIAKSVALTNLIHVGISLQQNYKKNRGL